MAEKEKNNCAHPACGCARREDSKYCSTYCEDAGSTLEIACGCGHIGCSIAGPIAQPAT